MKEHRPRIENNRIWDNESGVTSEFSSPVLRGNSLDGNQLGGSFRFGSPQIVGNEFTRNLEGLLLIAADAFVEGNSIEANEGLGVSLRVDRSLLRNNHIAANGSRSLSGGIYVSGGSPRIVQNVIVRNEGYRGGGLNVDQNGPTAIVAALNTFYDNRAELGSQIALHVGPGESTVADNLFVGTTATAPVYCAADPPVGDNLAFAPGAAASEGCPPAFADRLVNADPLFVNAVGNDFRLGEGSPAIDAGSADDPPERDFAGGGRVLDGDRDGEARIDFGAFEALPPRRLPLRSRTRSIPASR